MLSTLSYSVFVRHEEGKCTNAWQATRSTSRPLANKEICSTAKLEQCDGAAGAHRQRRSTVQNLYTNMCKTLKTSAITQTIWDSSGRVGFKNVT
ncbi:hypothetical protein QCA50_019096 [Cerrena zonata]|uniref:Uncharacterized protein n=1 Tax=Cerrena zonata TaxID=2478898 RepID=A0AAW0FBK5_9APHY